MNGAISEPSAPLPLFRAEVLPSASFEVSGQVLIAGPRLLTAGAALSMLLVVALVLMLSLGRYAPREMVSGYLAPRSGLIKVRPPRPGVITRQYVAEGDAVVANQPLITISIERSYVDILGRTAPERIGAEIIQQEAGLVDSLERAETSGSTQSEALQTKVRGIETELEQYRLELTAFERQRASTETGMQQLRKLQAAGYLTPYDITLKEQQLYALEREWHQLKRQVQAKEDELRMTRTQQAQVSIQTEQQKTDIKNRLSEVRRQGAALDTEREYVIISPVAGRVTAVQAVMGKLVSPSEPLMIITAEGDPLEAHLLVPSRAAGFVKKGQTVRLRYAAFPYQQYGTHQATVLDISETTLRPDEWATGIPTMEAMYRVRARLEKQEILLEGIERGLQSGAQFEADILQESRPLWQWLFKPLLSARGRW